VDRPNNGHRRHEAGSVTVVDLIRRQQGPVRIPSADEQATVQFMDDLLGSATYEADHPRGWLSKGAKLAGLALGSLALCGSVYAASTLTQHRQPAATGPNPTVLTGVGALRPDTVAAQLSGTRTAPTPTHSPAQPPVVLRHGASGTATGTIVGRPGPPATTTPPQPSAIPLTGVVTPASVVRTFYQLAATDPRLAAQLISPSLLATDPSGFDKAWNSLGNIEIESVQQTSPNTVEAAVRMLEPDGTWLRVIELLHVTDGNQPLINGAELLSAQRG
jgi:hypothetical protein